ncbi:Zinc finger C2H2 [Penicillium frequentans]|uniref:Zinc finger C2H2 n=1 Tax=Penicillium frequentans TaxID=3151616 RepID=A0AAD6CSL4_9EURO|nr:Zinc finger C2H2 [Penicillium glabrum]
MPPRGFTNPAPKTESARSALSSFTCTLCNKSYSRHPEYEAHIGSYDHQHRKRLQDLKQLSRDPNAAEKARRAERKADAQAGLRVIDAPITSTNSSGTGGGGFKKGGFKSSFAAVKGAAPVLKKNVLGDDDDDEAQSTHQDQPGSTGSKSTRGDDIDAESDTDEEYARDEQGGGYYDPRRPTGCLAGCAGLR